MDGKRGGDPAKLAHALVELTALEEPPVRFAAANFGQRAEELLAQPNAHHELSSSLAHNVA